MVVICDSSPIIALAQIDRLDLLARVYRQIVVPPTVAREVAPTVGMLPAWFSVRALGRPRQPQEVSGAIGPGEHEVISLGLELHASRLVLDEHPARRLACSLGLPVIGTLGLLLACKRQGILNRVKPELESLLAFRFFMDQELYDRVIREAGEQVNEA